MTKAFKSGRVTAVVQRDSRDETTMAFVSCKKTEEVQYASQLYERILKAVTAWVQDTHEGREAYEESGRDYNIGDFAADCGGHIVETLLQEYGIIDIEVELFCIDDFQSNWTYDMALVGEAVTEAGDGE